jgi:hypothetical protein
MIGRITTTAARTADTSVYRVDTSKQAAVHAVYLCNTTSSVRRVRLHHCRNGETSSTLNAMLYDAPIAPNGTLVEDTRFVLAQGDELRAMADASGVTIMVHGLVNG